MLHILLCKYDKHSKMQERLQFQDYNISHVDANTEAEAEGIAIDL